MALASTASSLLRAAVNATMNDSEDDFESLLQSTRRAFRPNNDLPIRNNRGRKKGRQMKRTVLLLRRSNADFLPSSNEIEFLTDRGLGKISDALFSRSWTLSQVESYVTSLYSQVPLNLVGFKYFKIKKNRQLQLIDIIVNTIDLFEKLGQGMLVIVPNRDLPVSTIPLLLKDSDAVNSLEADSIENRTNQRIEYDVARRRNDRNQNFQSSEYSNNHQHLNCEEVSDIGSCRNRNIFSAPQSIEQNVMRQRNDRDPYIETPEQVLIGNINGNSSSESNLRLRRNISDFTASRSTDPSIEHNIRQRINGNLPVDIPEPSLIGNNESSPVFQSPDHSSDINQAVSHSRLRRNRYNFTDTQSTSDLVINTPEDTFTIENDSIHNRLNENNFQHLENWEVELTEGSFSVFNLPSIDRDAELLNVYINRQDCMEDILSLYQNPEIINKKFNVELLGENGADAGGLTKEVFNIFWKGAERSYFVGEDCMVPFLPLHRIRKDSDTFIILGRIFSHMLLLTGTFPAKLSRAVFFSLADISPIDPKILQEDFLLFVSPVERYVLKKALNDFKTLTKYDMDTLANIFISYHFYDNPNESDFSDQLAVIAHEVLVERPKILINKFKNGVPEYMLNKFWRQCTADSIAYLLASFSPTATKILNSISSEELLNNDQSRILHYLRMFIGSLNKDDLLQFLFFVTGSYSMNFGTKIMITFNALRGNLRRPISHTCNNVLELSSIYSSYQDFKNEMNIYLNSTYSYEYTQV